MESQTETRNKSELGELEHMSPRIGHRKATAEEIQRQIQAAIKASAQFVKMRGDHLSAASVRAVAIRGLRLEGHRDAADELERSGYGANRAARRRARARSKNGRR